MKNIALIILILFLYNCGYSSVYKNLQLKNYRVLIIDEVGDDEMNRLIKTEVRLYSNKDSTNIYNLKVNTDYKKEALTKNVGGVITDYTLSVTSNFTIDSRTIAEELIDTNVKTQIFQFKEKMDIKILADSFEQSRYETSIKKNFASSIREKLMSALLSTDDN